MRTICVPATLYIEHDHYRIELDHNLTVEKKIYMKNKNLIDDFHYQVQGQASRVGVVFNP